jgi:hypothetical protein
MPNIMSTDNSKKEMLAAARRYRDIENGKVLPTFIEFFKIAILFGFAENVNLKDLYPDVYTDLKKGIDKRKKAFDAEKKKLSRKKERA